MHRIFTALWATGFLIITTLSAHAVTFQVSSLSGLSAENTVLSGITFSSDLTDGQSALRRSSFLITTTQLDNGNGSVGTPFDIDFTVDALGEQLTRSVSLSLTTFNNTQPGAPYGAQAILSQVSDTVFQFSFGDFTLFSGTLATTVCISCQINATASSFVFMNTGFSEATPVPLPAALPLLVVGVGVLALRRRRKP
jgi:hypothetical protein